jgi:hypothetical protein
VRLVVTKELRNKEPVVSAGPLLADGEAVIAFLELANPSPSEGRVRVVFEQTGAPPVGHVELKVPAQARKWRTWARSELVRQPGRWTARVFAPSGQRLAERSFELVAPRP